MPSVDTTGIGIDVSSYKNPSPESQVEISSCKTSHKRKIPCVNGTFQIDRSGRSSLPLPPTLTLPKSAVP